MSISKRSNFVELLVSFNNSVLNLYLERLENFTPNNAYFSGFGVYSNDLPRLKNELKVKFNENLKSMIDFYELKYESL